MLSQPLVAKAVELAMFNPAFAIVLRNSSISSTSLVSITAKPPPTQSLIVNSFIFAFVFTIAKPAPSIASQFWIVPPVISTVLSAPAPNTTTPPPYAVVLFTLFWITTFLPSTKSAPSATTIAPLLTLLSLTFLLSPSRTSFGVDDVASLSPNTSVELPIDANNVSGLFSPRVIVVSTAALIFTVAESAAYAVSFI